MGLARQAAIMGGNVTLIEKSLTLTGNNTTVIQNIFQITESILVVGLWGEVTTVLGSNITVARLGAISSSTFQTAMCTGATLSNFSVGSILGIGTRGAEAMLTIGGSSSAAAARAGSVTGVSFLRGAYQVVKADPGNASYIGLEYATTDAPTSGVIKFRLWYEKITTNGAAVAA